MEAVMYVTNPTQHFKYVVSNIVCNPRDRRNVLNYKNGKNLFQEGDEATHVFEVASGVVCLSRTMENGRRQVIAFGYPGDIVGFHRNGLHNTDCDVLTNARLILHRREHLDCGKADPTLHRRLLRSALREISGMQDHFMMLGRKSASEKLASFLSVLSDRVGEPLGAYTQFALPMTRSDIADFLGLTTETVSRTFSQLRKCRIIALENAQSVIVLNPTALLELSIGND